MHGTEHRRRRHKREVALEGALDGNAALVAVPVEATAEDDSSPTPASERPEANDTCIMQVPAQAEGTTRELLALAWPIAAAMLGETYGNPVRLLRKNERYRLEVPAEGEDGLM